MVKGSFGHFTQLLLFPWSVKKLTANFLRFPGCGTALPFVSIVFILINSKSTLKSLVRLYSEREVWLVSFMNSLGLNSPSPFHLISVGYVFYSLLRFIRDSIVFSHTNSRSFLDSDGLLFVCIWVFWKYLILLCFWFCYLMVLLIVMWGFGEIKKLHHCCHHPRILHNSKTFLKCTLYLKHNSILQHTQPIRRCPSDIVGCIIDHRAGQKGLKKSLWSSSLTGTSSRSKIICFSAVGFSMCIGICIWSWLEASI